MTASTYQSEVALPATPSPDRRRRDIQGLRAMAVLMVVAFHADLPVPGGFVGVDVFFVVSGFVITSMLAREWRTTGRIRFGRFYVRRFKRLTPALALTVGTTMLLTFALLPPFGAQQTAAQTALGAMLLSANFVIASATGEYFDPTAEVNPLLNTWSLSVEEQFYLVFPGMLVAGWSIRSRVPRARLAPCLIVALVAAASFAVAVWGPSEEQGKWAGILVGFYSPVSRAWEFAVGALLALAANRVKITSPAIASTFGGLGAALLGASLWLIDGETPFPGPWTLMPVAGSLFLLAAGMVGTNTISKLLGSAPLVKIGDLSYSIYLWHWPFIVFSLSLWPRTPGAALFGALLSIVPAVASYRWVEQPIRSLSGLGRARLSGLVAAVVLPPVLLAGVVGEVANRFWLPRYTAGVIPVANEGDVGHTDFFRYETERNHPCTPRSIREHSDYWEGLLRCQQSQATGPVRIALVGDSHAEHLFLGLAEALPKQNIAYYQKGQFPARSVSQDMARIIDHVAGSPSIQTVVVNVFWSRRGVPADGLEETLALFRASGKTVFVTDDIPSFSFDPVQCKYRKAPLVPAGECSQGLEVSLADYERYESALRNAVNAVPGVVLLSTWKYFCDDDSCDMARDGRLLYRDPNHLSINGSRYLVGRLFANEPAFRAAMESAGRCPDGCERR